MWIRNRNYDSQCWTSPVYDKLYLTYFMSYWPQTVVSLNVVPGVIWEEFSVNWGRRQVNKSWEICTWVLHFHINAPQKFSGCLIRLITMDSYHSSSHSGSHPSWSALHHGRHVCLECSFSRKSYISGPYSEKQVYPRDFPLIKMATPKHFFG